jgi:tetratricopeptide (TPR) repeat protein
MIFEELVVKARRAYDEKRYREALEYLTKALGLKPHKSLFYLKGLALYKVQEYDNAIKNFGKALELDSSLGDVWEAKGDALCMVWKFREAVDCYKRALELAHSPRLKEKIKTLTYIWDY